MLTHPARIGSAKPLPALAAVIAHQAKAMCYHCGGQWPELNMLVVYPEPGITKRCCESCERNGALSTLVTQAKRIASLQNKYLERNGYAAVAGTRIFAANAKLCKVVAFVNGRFTRGEMKTIILEARELGLLATRLTILVNGLAVYSGGSMQVIRIDEHFASEDTGDGLLADLMADARAAKLLKRYAIVSN